MSRSEGLQEVTSVANIRQDFTTIGRVIEL